MRRYLAALILCLTATAFSGETLQVSRWNRAAVPPHRVRAVDGIVDRIIANRGRYETVTQATGVPFFALGSLHNMEASGSFKLHLHEGSPLTARTRYVPKGRPKTGTPPFTWEFSAADAMAYDKMGEVNWQSLDASLYACERYNGTGYLRFHPDVPTPYLWAGTTIERNGKYIADGKWSSTARSSQIGVAAIWKRLEARKLIKLPR